MAHILSIVYQPVNQKYDDRSDTFIRVPTESAQLVAGHGIEGDRKAGRHPKRQLNLLSATWVEARKQEGYKTEPGDFGEQMTVSGLDFSTLRPGDRLRLGAEAVIEISKPRTGCTRLELAQGNGLAGVPLIGLLASVITGGQIQVGDAVEHLLPASEAEL